MNPLNKIISAMRGKTPEPLREAFSSAGAMVDNDDAEWRPLSGNSNRDLTPMTQRRMQDLAVYLWESNLLANRLVELPVSYILAEGVKLKAEDPTIQALIDDFWAHPVNNFDIKLVKKVRELALYGEQCWPAFVNQFDGSVRLGYLDPQLIDSVVVDPDNGEQPIGIITVANANGESKRYKVILNGAENELFTAQTQALRDTFNDGECFYFCVNDLSNGRRGRSDLLSQTDWLDSYDQFMFGELDRVQFLRAFMWDVTLAGATEADVNAKAQTITTPKPGSVRVHNDAESWQAVSPTINASDTDTTAKLFRNHVLGGATIPEHWFGGGGDVNRATGEDMTGPTFKMMSMRQAFIGYMLAEVGRYVIRQWELAHTKKEPDLNDPIYQLEVSWPEMIPKDTTKYASALQQVTQAVSMAVTGGLMSKKTAVEMIESVAGRLGVKFDAEEELAAVASDKPENPEKDPNTPEKPLRKSDAESDNENLTEAKITPVAPVPDPIPDLLDNLEQQAQPHIDSMIEAVAAMLDSADSLPDAFDKIQRIMPDLDSTSLAELLGQAIMASNLTGQDQVKNGR